MFSAVLSTTDIRQPIWRSPSGLLVGGWVRFALGAVPGTPRTLRHRRADRIIVSLSHVPYQIVTLGQQRKHSLDGPRVLKFASGVSLAATFDGEFSDVTRTYARQGRGALAQSKPAPA
jgi:hypothetical protein